MQSVVAAFFETQKKLARSTRRARRFLEGMSLPNPKNDNKGQAICILNPDGIPSHSPGLAEGLPLGNGFFKRRYATSLLLSGLPWAEAHGYHKLSRCDNLEEVVPS
jgi:hypothetical protein